MSADKATRIEMRKLTDCTSRFSDEYFLHHLRSYGPVLLNRPALDLELEKDGVILDRYGALDEVNAQIKELILSSPRFAYNLIASATRTERRLSRKARVIQNMIQLNEVVWDKVYDYFMTTVYYASHRIRHSYSFDFLKKCLQEVVPTRGQRNLSNELFCNLQISTSYTYYAYFFVELINAALRWEKGDLASLSRFIEKAGFIDTRTIRPSVYEDQEYVKSACSQMIATQGRQGLREMLASIKLNRMKSLQLRALSLDYVAIHRFLSKSLEPDQFLAYCHLASFIMTFEEKKHYWRIRLFRTLRILSQNYFLDPQQTTLSDLERAIKKNSS